VGVAAQRGTEKEKPAATEFFGQLSQQIDAFSGEILAGAAMVVDAPRLLDWARGQMLDGAARRLWSEAALAFGVIFGAAAIAEWPVRRMLSHLQRRLPVRRSDTPLIRACFALFRRKGGIPPSSNFLLTTFLRVARGPWPPEGSS